MFQAQPQYGFASQAPTMTVTGVDLNRDGIPDVLQQPQLGYGAPMQYGGPVNYAAQAPMMTVTGVDMNRDGIPDVLQQPQIGFAPQGFGAPVQYGAPVNMGRRY
uniref:Uncharacterized protein n=1 Tax=Noctiluca scintillans TaxID=2966 RepID=A0A7S1FHF2_NOCSC|mmetsp:Transcript_63783/g.168847  ORF Transcript_63783/g.168847 Transcript_63783/m.168847 type:complete len:104 (+) Transcript_63783:83-394(+)